MAFKRKLTKSSGILSNLTPLAVGIAGGFVGNQMTGFLEKQSFMSGKEALAPAVTLVASFGASMFLNDTLKEFAKGASIVSGTELLEGLISKGVTAVQGVAPMGYVPDIQATGPNGYETYGGGSIR